MNAEYSSAWNPARAVAANHASWPARYELLDGLRGLAALAVVLHHLGVASFGHYAVMVFFVISGYCIAASADSALRSGTGLGAFIAKRVRRIYPPYLCALAFFTATRLLKGSLNGNLDFKRPALEWLQNLTLTQWITDLFHPVHWPGQNSTLFVAAFWSLNYEEQFYLVMSCCILAAAALRVPVVISVLFLAVCGLIWNWSIPGNWICGFFIEYWVHFAMGVCLFFVLCRYTAKWCRAAFVGTLLAIGLASAMRLHPLQAGAEESERALVELVFLTGVTLTLYCLRPLSKTISETTLWRPMAALGTISFSLYLVHQFNLHVMAAIARKLLPVSAPSSVGVATTVALHLMLATAFWYVCERPFLARPPNRALLTRNHGTQR